MSNNFIEDYIKAGKAVIAAKKLAKNLIKPGQSFLEIANKCEAEIINSGCELSFPINMSLNEIAAHYSPPIGDQTKVPERGLLKIDIGSHFNGYIADSAFTVNIDEDPKLQNYIDAATEAVEAAIELFKPGTKLYEMGEVINKRITEYGLRPIKNLGGHELKRYILHAGPFIPNYKNVTNKEVLKKGDAYACEPFATSGVGWVDNGEKSFIYRFVKKVTKGIPYELQNYMTKIEKATQRLPFSPRLLENNNIIPKAKIKRTIQELKRKKILHHYPLLIEQSGAPVAQQEHTMVIDMDGNTIVTTRE